MKWTRLYRLWYRKNTRSLRIIRIIPTLGMALLLTGCNHLLYPASRESFIDKNFLKPPPTDLTIPLMAPPENSYLHAWYFPAQSKTKKGLVVHFHGNGQNLTTHFGFFRWVTNFGFDYLIFDYRGYGQSSDESASQKKTIKDGEAIFDFIHKNFKPKKVIAIGQSLGSNVLVRTLQDLNPTLYPDLVVLDSSFTSYKAAARSVLSQKWFLYPLIPLSYIAIDDDFSAAAQMNKTPALPAIFFHGTADTLIKKENGIDNFNRWPGKKVLVLDEGGAHTSAFGDPRFMNKNKDILLSCFSFIEKNDLNHFEDCAKK